MQEISFDQFINLENSLDPSVMTVNRVGLIPIIENNGNKYYVLGTDRKTSLLSDFGGHCDVDSNGKIELPKECLKRELREEMGGLLSSYIISKLNNEEVRKKSKIIIKNNGTTAKIEIFMKFDDINGDIYKLIQKFTPTDEIREIKIYDIEYLEKNTVPSTYISSVEFFMKDLLKK